MTGSAVQRGPFLIMLVFGLYLMTGSAIQRGPFLDMLVFGVYVIKLKRIGFRVGRWNRLGGFLWGPVLGLIFGIIF